MTLLNKTFPCGYRFSANAIAALALAVVSFLSWDVCGERTEVGRMISQCCQGYDMLRRTCYDNDQEASDLRRAFHYFGVESAGSCVGELRRLSQENQFERAQTLMCTDLALTLSSDLQPLDVCNCDMTATTLTTDSAATRPGSVSVTAQWNNSAKSGILTRSDRTALLRTCMALFGKESRATCELQRADQIIRFGAETYSSTRRIAANCIPFEQADDSSSGDGKSPPTSTLNITTLQQKISPTLESFFRIHQAMEMALVFSSLSSITADFPPLVEPVPLLCHLVHRPCSRTAPDALNSYPMPLCSTVCERLSEQAAFIRLFLRTPNTSLHLDTLVARCWKAAAMTTSNETAPLCCSQVVMSNVTACVRKENSPRSSHNSTFDMFPQCPQLYIKTTTANHWTQRHMASVMELQSRLRSSFPQHVGDKNVAEIFQCALDCIAYGYSVSEHIIAKLIINILGWPFVLLSVVLVIYCVRHVDEVKCFPFRLLLVGNALSLITITVILLPGAIGLRQSEVCLPDGALAIGQSITSLSCHAQIWVFHLTFYGGGLIWIALTNSISVKLEAIASDKPSDEPNLFTWRREITYYACAIFFAVPLSSLVYFLADIEEIPALQTCLVTRRLRLFTVAIPGGVYTAVGLVHSFKSVFYLRRIKMKVQEGRTRTGRMGSTSVSKNLRRLEIFIAVYTITSFLCHILVVSFSVALDVLTRRWHERMDAYVLCALATPSPERHCPPVPRLSFIPMIAIILSIMLNSLIGLLWVFAHERKLPGGRRSTIVRQAINKISVQRHQRGSHTTSLSLRRMGAPMGGNNIPETHQPPDSESLGATGEQQLSCSQNIIEAEWHSREQVLSPATAESHHSFNEEPKLLTSLVPRSRAPSINIIRVEDDSFDQHQLPDNFSLPGFPSLNMGMKKSITSVDVVLRNPDSTKADDSLLDALPRKTQRSASVPTRPSACTALDPI